MNPMRVEYRDGKGAPVDGSLAAGVIYVDRTPKLPSGCEQYGFHWFLCPQCNRTVRGVVNTSGTPATTRLSIDDNDAPSLQDWMVSCDSKHKSFRIINGVFEFEAIS